MLKRIIPCLDIKNNKVVKGVQFADLETVGDPIKIAEKYSEEGADELAMLNISSAVTERKFLNLVEKITKTVRIPLIVGGRMEDSSDIEKLLNGGVNKVCIYTSFVKTPEFLIKSINQLQKKIDAKRIIAGLDIKRKRKSWIVIGKDFRETSLDAIKWARKLKRNGFKEILFTSMDRNGTNKGYDVEFSNKLKENLSLPIIAAGGAGRKEDFLRIFKKGKADAALAASIFHFGKLSILELKKYLYKNSIDVKL